MKILNIFPVDNINANRIQNSVKNTKFNDGYSKQSYITQNNNLPNTKTFLSFCGGYSLNLDEVYSALKPEEYPSDIRENVKNEQIEKSGKSLYDVHFDKYEGVLDCYSLNELKEKYPEFKDVISSYEVEAKPGSIVSDFQEGKSQIFSQDEDLTLQLIKLYWGKGFSLTDLSKYFQESSDSEEKKSLYYAMHKKLNIPLMNKRYANVLKLSNKEYNESFTREMSIKIKEAKEAAIQRQEGEAVIIPRGPLSESHKKHISEGLKKYYQENPDAIYNMSQRQKDFYENNPDLKEEFAQVLNRAWNHTHDGKVVKKALIKSMKKYGKISESQLIGNESITNEQKNALKFFWNNNQWAVQKFSNAMKQGWQYVKVDSLYKMDGKTIPGIKISNRLAPKKIIEDIKKFAQKRNYNVDETNILTSTTFFNINEKQNRKNQQSIMYVNNVLHEYFKIHPEVEDNIATTLQGGLMLFLNDLESNSDNLPKSLKNNIEKRKIMMQVIAFKTKDDPIFVDEGNDKLKRIPIDGVPIAHLVDIYQSVMDMALDYDCCDVAEYMNKNLDMFYEIVNQGFKPYINDFIKNL